MVDAFDFKIFDDGSSGSVSRDGNRKLDGSLLALVVNGLALDDVGPHFEGNPLIASFVIAFGTVGVFVASVFATVVVIVRVSKDCDGVCGGQEQGYDGKKLG